MQANVNNLIFNRCLFSSKLHSSKQLNSIFKCVYLYVVSNKLLPYHYCQTKISMTQDILND